MTTAATHKFWFVYDHNLSIGGSTVTIGDVELEARAECVYWQDGEFELRGVSVNTAGGWRQVTSADQCYDEIWAKAVSELEENLADIRQGDADERADRKQRAWQDADLLGAL